MRRLRVVWAAYLHLAHTVWYTANRPDVRPLTVMNQQLNIEKKLLSCRLEIKQLTIECDYTETLSHRIMISVREQFSNKYE